MMLVSYAKTILKNTESPSLAWFLGLWKNCILYKAKLGQILYNQVMIYNLGYDLYARVGNEIVSLLVLYIVKLGYKLK